MNGISGLEVNGIEKEVLLTFHYLLDSDNFQISE
jgi:hypothetical protein